MKVFSDKKFGKYPAGEAFELPDKMARKFIKVGKLTEVNGSPVLPDPKIYQTRMMQAEPDAPWGFKADGTPRKRPGRPASVTE